MLRFAPGKHPGDGYIYVICDICGRKVRQKDTVLVNDRYNLQNKLIVCKMDLDKRNEQIRLASVRENPTPNPAYLRPEQPFRYVPDSGTRLPSAPRDLYAQASVITNRVYLIWSGPDNLGDGRLIGFQINRAEPQFSYPFVIVENTNSPAMYYDDITSNLNSNYTYQVAAITTSGMGPYSAPAYYPRLTGDLSTNLLLVSQTNDALITSDTLQTINVS